MRYLSPSPSQISPISLLPYSLLDQLLPLLDLFNPLLHLGSTILKILQHFLGILRSLLARLNRPLHWCARYGDCTARCAGELRPPLPGTGLLTFDRRATREEECQSEKAPHEQERGSPCHAGSGAACHHTIT